MSHLQGAGPETSTALCFSGVSFIDISCADEFLCKLILRIGSGELGTRYVYVEGANVSVRETLEAVLKLRGLAVLCRQDGTRLVLGTLKRPTEEALAVVLERGRATSSEVADALGKNVNIACNRLNALQRIGLVCRVREESVPGGGRQYLYQSIV